MTTESTFTDEFTSPFAETVRDLLGDLLLMPVQRLFKRPAKMIRGRMVRAGFLLSGTTAPMTPGDVIIAEQRCDRLADVLEAVHAGSLIVDDIQDGSQFRRGFPTLHEIYGVPVALNAGNCLYFWPMQWIRTLHLPEVLELRLYQLYHDALLRAHLGQALDVGTRIDTLSKDRIASVCMAALELKTGALMAFALSSGSVIGDAGPNRIRLLQDFGRRFGVALQMFDDLSNLSLPSNDPKRFEDLRLQRPTWIWAAAATHSSSDEYADLLAAVSALPDETQLIQWFDRTDFLNCAHAEAQRYLAEPLRALEDLISTEAADSSQRTAEGLAILRQLANQIEVSNGC